MNRSPDRNTFQINAYLDRCRSNGEAPNEAYLNMYQREIEADLENENDEEWKKDNLEYDLRSTEWICNKVKASKSYAQNLYAALCNNEFQKNEVWAQLKNEVWACSWRYAGGIVANMCEEGDYIDWYCSGIRNIEAEEKPELEYVSESTVTDEIRDDLFKLGWLLVPRSE